MSFDLLAVFTVNCNPSVSFPFLFLCFLFFFVKDQTASFQLKEIVVFLNYKMFRVYIYFIAWLRPSLNYSRFRVLHAVDSLDVKRELRSKRVKQFCQLFCYYADITKRYFLVCHLKIVFCFLHELKQRWGDVTGRH